MNQVRHNTPADRLKRLNARIPLALDHEDAAIAKRLRKPHITPLDGLETLYGHIDRFMAYTSGLAACQKGCAYCCHSQVAVSKLEADYIVLKTGRQAAAVRVAPMVSEQFCDFKRPCPFLLAGDKSCSIYAHRPMLCRTHLSIESSNTPCQFDANPGQTIMLLDRTRSWPGAMQAYVELVKRHGESWADIRDYFGHPKGAVNV